jgi:hypothetical protein
MLQLVFQSTLTHTQGYYGWQKLRGEAMDWKHLLAYITGAVDQELLLRNEYLVTENRILRNQLTGRVRLTDGERKALAEIGQKLGKKALEEVAKIVKPDTILAWHRQLVAQKCDGSTQRKAPGRPTIDQERAGGPGGAYGAREPFLGLRPDRRRPGQPWVYRE